MVNKYVLKIIHVVLIINIHLYVHAQTSISSVPSYTWDVLQTPREFGGKLQIGFVRGGATSYPDYGTVLTGGGYPVNDGGTFQLYFPYNVTYGGVAPKIRLGKYNNAGWSDWQTFFTTANANNDTSDWTAKKMTVTGNLGIGVANPTERLSVNGNIRAKEIKVEATNWPDYVFKDEYELSSLENIHSFIKKNGHLPDVPKASEVEQNGISLGEMNKILLQKIEELTLHLIKKDNEILEIKKYLKLN